jgi:hypothetical protein
VAEHSPIGASGYHRWGKCPGSVSLSERAPKRPDSKYAKVGTAAHEVLERCYPDGDPWDYLGKAMCNGVELAEEDIQAVEDAMNLIKDECANGKWTVYKEVRFQLQALHPGLFGTCDICLMSEDFKKLKIIDYKHGSGVLVEAEENPQLLYYALGAINELYDDVELLGGWGKAFREIEIGIIQPRAYHVDGPYRKWSPAASKLDEFAAELKRDADAALKPGAELVAGDHCRFCPALSICPQITNHTTELAQADFSVIASPTLPKVEGMTAEQMERVMNFTPIIKEWLDEIHNRAYQMLERGEEVPGYKLVKKRSNRKWQDEEEAADMLSLYVSEDDLYKKKMVSPAQAEKLLNKEQKKAIEPYIIKPESGNTIAPMHDKRAMVAGSANNDFAVIEERK